MPVDATKGDIIIVSMKQPTVTIDLDAPGECTISGIKLTHCGFNED